MILVLSEPRDNDFPGSCAFSLAQLHSDMQFFRVLMTPDGATDMSHGYRRAKEKENEEDGRFLQPVQISTENGNFFSI